MIEELIKNKTVFGLLSKYNNQLNYVIKPTKVNLIENVLYWVELNAFTKKLSHQGLDYDRAINVFSDYKVVSIPEIYCIINGIPFDN